MQDKGIASKGDMFDLTFDLQELSIREESLMPYVDYICAVLDLYAAICTSRNADGAKRVKELGLS